MAKNDCPKCPDEGLPLWMGTYGDLVTLLMAFFVLLFAFSSMDSQKFKTIMKAFQGALGVMQGGKTLSPEQLITDSRIQSKGMELKFQQLAKEIQQAIEEQENKKKMKQSDIGDEKKSLEESATVKITQQGIEISLGAKTLFDSGKSELKAGANEIINMVYDKVRGIDNEVVVKGHTDNVPISTLRYPSNWELSTSRATNILRYLLSVDNSLKGRVSAAGYSDTVPITTNDTPEGRQKNRRVEIVILKSMESRVKEAIVNQ